MNKEYFIDIAEDILAYVYFLIERGNVKEFVVKLLCAFEGQWHEVIRYDSGHEYPHKDILDIDGNVVRKVWYDYLDNNEALTMAISDIKDNYEFYKDRYLKWLKRN
ncbi:hypothetical protein MCHI_002380 [Candidatus Magnetoovum chiemensis]|nr:hypothetical protein MCHI_002380 [Candidatus Magnetoovum chiemensis]